MAKLNEFHLIISNWLFDMWPFSNRAHLESIDCPDAINSRNLKISLGFLASASSDEIENWQVWLKFDLISILLICYAENRLNQRLKQNFIRCVPRQTRQAATLSCFLAPT